MHPLVMSIKAEWYVTPKGWTDSRDKKAPLANLINSDPFVVPPSGKMIRGGNLP